MIPAGRRINSPWPIFALARDWSDAKLRIRSGDTRPSQSARIG
jgi:hypothetical protein